MADSNPVGIDAYKPSQIYILADLAGVQKTRLSVPQLLVLSVLAGAFIGLGAAAYTMVMTGADLSFGPARFLGGIVFSLGLILVILAGAELFTGNALLVITGSLSTAVILPVPFWLPCLSGHQPFSIRLRVKRRSR
jgi:formate/nitrite transporter FocA (FNT family)